MAPETSSRSDRKYLPELGTELRSTMNVYRLLTVLGEGGFGTVFEARRGSRRYAMKVEKYNKSMLHVEAAVLTAAERLDCKHICRLVDYGAQRPDFTFVVMSLLGSNIHSLQSEQPRKRFSTATALFVGAQTLEAIEELHKCGFISRDIKPANFAVGLSSDMMHRTIFLFDFGLARRYCDQDGNLFASRGEMGWRGTTRYASLKSHEKQDLGQRDDMESWFYHLVEITSGTLPWRHVPDRDNVHIAKKMARNGSRIHLLHNCPTQYDELLTVIDATLFEDKPNYRLLHNIITKASDENKLEENFRLDWEEDESLTNAESKPSMTASGDTAVVFDDDDVVPKDASVFGSSRFYSSI